MAIAAHTTSSTTAHPGFRNAVPVATPDLTAETITMLAALSADTPERKRNGTIRAIVVRGVPHRSLSAISV